MSSAKKLAWRVDPEGGCWNCTSHAPDSSGYPRVTRDGEMKRVSRYAWEQANGRPVPDGMLVCHRCDNKMCINPAHLWLGTNGDNVSDRNAKGRQASGESNGKAKLTDEQVRYIRQHTEIGQLQMAKKMDVSQGTVSDVVRGRTWKHLL